MKTLNNPNQSLWSEEIQRPTLDTKSLEESTQTILNEVRKKGDEAVSRYTKFFDRVEIDGFEVSALDLQKAVEDVSPELKEAIDIAYKNIYTFHNAQLPGSTKIETSPGVICEQVYRPIENVGLYIPGGSAPLFSTVLMLGIPAQIAGCKNRILCSPPNKEGKINSAILYAAQKVGITRVFRVGGIQAIGALAYGTESIPKVDKIFGPGNQFVTAAKSLVNKDGIAIDMPAGPSELLVWADEKANPSFVASDLLSQAEHGGDSQVVLVAPNLDFIKKVKTEVETQKELLSRIDIVNEALQKAIFVAMEDEQAALNLINWYGPEHLIITKEDRSIVEEINNAGSIFLGPYTPESAGDYASGTNHTLPTNGFSKAYSGLNTLSFMKSMTIQTISAEGIQNLGPTIEVLAQNEGLDAHAQAVTKRLIEQTIQV